MKSHPSPRRVLTLLGFGSAISLLGDATLYTVLPHPTIAAQVGVTLGMVGVLLSANRAVRLVLNGPVGVLYDRLPRRGLLVASLAIGALSSAIYAIGSGFWPLLAGRMSWGLAWSLLWIGGNTVILDISNDENRGRYSGGYQVWFFLGVAFSSFFGGVLTDQFGFRMGQWISAGLIAGAAVLWFFLLPETRPANPGRSTVQADSTIRGPFPWRVILEASASMFVVRFVGWGVLPATAILWLSGFLGDGVRISGRLLPIVTLTGIYTALSMVASVASASGAGLFSDKIGRRWPVVAAAMLLGGAGIWLMSGGVFSLALAGGFLAPVAGASVETLVPAIAGDRVDLKLRGRALGLIYTIADLGSTLGPLVALGLLDLGWLPGEAGLAPISISGLYKTGAALYAFVAILALVRVRRGPPSR